MKTILPTLSTYRRLTVTAVSSYLALFCRWMTKHPAGQWRCRREWPWSRPVTAAEICWGCWLFYYPVHSARCHASDPGAGIMLGCPSSLCNIKSHIIYMCLDTENRTIGAFYILKIHKGQNRKFDKLRLFLVFCRMCDSHFTPKT